MGADYPFPGALDPQDNYSAATGWKVRDDFSLFRAGGSYFAAVGGDWLLRAAVNGQYAHSGLPSVEQMGMTGWLTVRGFNERVVARDRGYVANLEVYTPELAASMGLPGSFKLLGFYDSAQGFNVATTINQHVAIASAGVGLRYILKKDLSVRFDVARVLGWLYAIGWGWRPNHRSSRGYLPRPRRGCVRVLVFRHGTSGKIVLQCDFLPSRRAVLAL